MSRYHPVRPRKDKEHPASAEASDYAKAMSDESAGRRQVPQPAAPAQSQANQQAPSQQEMQRERLHKATAELYKLYHGDTIDAGIARCNRLLAIHDREAEKVLKDEPVGGYRWTVSPSMYMRLQTQLEKFEARRDELMERCWQEGKRLIEEITREMGDSLRQAKQQAKQPEPASAKASADMPAPMAGKQPDPVSAPADPQPDERGGGQGQPSPIAA